MSAAPSLAQPGEDLASLARVAALDLQALVGEAGRRLRARLVTDGRVSTALLDAEQHAAHALAWLSTYATAIGELAAYAERMTREGRFDPDYWLVEVDSREGRHLLDLAEPNAD